MRPFGSTAAAVLMSSAAAAQDVGFACYDEARNLGLVLAFHEGEEGPVALIDGNVENPLSAKWDISDNILGSFEGPDFLAVLYNNLQLDVLSKSNGLVSFTCTDVTAAARTLNNDFGKLAELRIRMKELEANLNQSEVDLQLAREELKRAREEPKTTKSQTTASLARLIELEAEIAELKAQNERLIKNSRMWQDVIARLREQLQEK
ncbi:hypothetical protein [Marivita geojedonensis]|uniref:Uncharacterized protein n=1 Tax=Marivita geojedonensis TaxID=1123756 RepID=A0A1X4NFA5_9RHOB|nr:hypothetical protein [Marivita geojedonensis]OSQ45729.1 hypothetical protein MGEO_17680 [Marivita geojedonensis]PRY74055.1 hypothetical protein CLV76_12452 [Marivita geojedonensis]